MGVNAARWLKSSVIPKSLILMGGPCQKSNCGPVGLALGENSENLSPANSRGRYSKKEDAFGALVAKIRECCLTQPVSTQLVEYGAE